MNFFHELQNWHFVLTGSDLVVIEVITLSIWLVADFKVQNFQFRPTFV